MKKMLFFFFCFLLSMSSFANELKQQNLDKIDEYIEELHQTSNISYIICLKWFENKNIDEYIAVPVCKCEKEILDKEMPFNYVVFYQDNINNLDYLISKNDNKAIYVSERIKEIRLNCLNRLEKTINF